MNHFANFDRRELASWAVHVLALLATLLLALALAAAQGTTPAMAKDTTATALIIEGDSERTKFYAEISAETGFTVTITPNPYRVIIDMANVSFDLPPGAGRKAKGLIKQVRYGVIEEGKSRIVIDTAGPVLIERSWLQPAKGKSKARVALRLVATTDDVFAAAFAKDNEAVAPAAEQPVNTASLDKKAGHQSVTSTEHAVPADQAHAKPLIVIDPGHGGIDPGAMSPHQTKEKDIVLAFAKALQTAIRATGRFDVKMTRDDDRFVPLTGRVKFAREQKADLFIAIHADTVRGQTVRGTTLYTLSEKASDAEAEALAQKENRADIIAGMDLGTQNEEVADILIDLAQRESKNHATMFSRQALERLKGVTLMTGKPLRSAGFVVLKAPDVPSVLIELGYLSSKEDEEKLKSSTWQARMAKAMASAIDGYFKETVAAASP